MRSRWLDDPGVPRGDAYQARFDDLAASGTDVHGEADLVEAVLSEHAPPPGDTRAGAAQRVLDAGCGTGRVAVELHRRARACGEPRQVVGVDLDPDMLAVARRVEPEVAWVEADLATLEPDPDGFDLVVLAGNVLVFVAPGTEAEVVRRCVARLRPGGLLLAGFQVRTGGYGPESLDADARAAGADLVVRWATWDRRPWAEGDGRYQVSLHRAPTPHGPGSAPGAREGAAER